MGKIKISAAEKADPLIHPFEAGSGIEAGVDEVGRGCGAGPVVAAAVILPPKAKIPGLRDSKKLTASKRKELSGKIRELALDYSIAISTVEEIDQINILEATYLAMTRAIAQLKIKPDLLVIDGNRFKNQTGINHRTVVGGDDKVLSIAAASVLAKTWRDAYMEELHIEFPQYDWINNKGYLSTKHRQACFTHGLTPHHRKSFKGMTRQDDET